MIRMVQFVATAALLVAAMLLVGCDDLLEDDYEDEYEYDDDTTYGSVSDDNGSDGTGNQCTLSSVWRGPDASIQITSQCQSACFYREAGNIEGVRATCDILSTWSGHADFDAKGSCLACD